MNYSLIIEELYQKIRAEENEGKVASYIPELSKIDPDKFGVCLTTSGHKSYGTGDFQEKFSIQSVAKVLSLSLAYSMQGENIPLASHKNAR